MSFTSSPILNSIRLREEIADARKTAAIIAVLCAFSGFTFIGFLLGMVQ